MSLGKQSKTTKAKLENKPEAQREMSSTRPSYADLLCTESILNTSLQLLPWFSEEVRLSTDPRIRWVDLSTVESETNDSNQDHSQSKISNSNQFIQHANQQSIKQDLDHENEAISGHYLDHIETVQERDQRSKQKRNRRPKKAKSNTSQQAPSLKQTSESPKKQKLPTQKSKKVRNKKKS